MPKFELDPLEWLKGSKMEPFYDREETGFFHVTTRADQVERSKKIKSRDQLDSEDENAPRGLAGGPGDVVSFTFLLSRARVLWSAMRAMSRMMHGELSNSELMEEFFHWTGFPDNPMWKKFEDRSRHLRAMSRFVLAMNMNPEDVFDLDEMHTSRDWIRFVRDYQDHFNEMGSGDMYMVIRDCENYLEQAMGQEMPPGRPSTDLCTRTIGFFAKYNDFAKIQPDQISIVQVAVRKGSDIGRVNRECELRIRPKDLKLVCTRVEERGHVVLGRGK